MIDLNELRRHQCAKADWSVVELLIDENLRLRTALISQACLTAYYNGRGRVNFLTPGVNECLMFEEYLCDEAEQVLKGAIRSEHDTHLQETMSNPPQLQSHAQTNGEVHRLPGDVARVPEPHALRAGQAEA